jgi:DNA replicative helicase MCM subunit Mcm2 (Cdc46/Mcm family)
MHVLSQKHFNLDYVFLRKYIHHIHTSHEFDQIEFEDREHTLRLRDYWINLMQQNPEFAGNRSFESLFKIAKTIARTMLKTTVDAQVMEETLKFTNTVFGKHGTQVKQPIDYFSTTYLQMCEVGSIRRKPAKE